MFKRIIYILLCLLLITPINAYAKDIDISAECAVVLDVSTKRVLFEKSAYLKHSMASTTKLMTCLLACESKRLNELLTINNSMLNGVEGTSLYLKVGDTITLLDLVKGAMLESGNDCANAIAVFLKGDIPAFADVMNAKAKQIGMNNTNFVTPSGLDAHLHYSSAYDMALLAAYCCNNKELLSIASSYSDVIIVNGQKRTLYNHNKLLKKSKNFIGFKTGFTEKSGRCLVSCYNYDGSNIIVVTLNAPDDWNDHVKLIRKVKSKYSTKEENVTINVNTVGAVKEQIKCVCKYKLKTCGKLTVKYYYYPFIYAPLNKGDKVGTAEIYSDNVLVKTVDILSNEDLNYG